MLLNSFGGKSSKVCCLNVKLPIFLSLILFLVLSLITFLIFIFSSCLVKTLRFSVKSLFSFKSGLIL